eukprot:scaffold1800_cov332-Pavlova_lutheri.AAC.12
MRWDGRSAWEESLDRSFFSHSILARVVSMAGVGRVTAPWHAFASLGAPRASNLARRGPQILATCFVTLSRPFDGTMGIHPTVLSRGWETLHPLWGPVPCLRPS